MVANAPSGWIRPQAETASAPAALAPRATTTPEPHPAKNDPPPITKEDFKNDPLVKQALEIFKGTIVEVRA